jgi:hypothetical protein
MTPKEKAKELVGRYVKFKLNGRYKIFGLELAKELALIAVDEIINNSLEYMGCDLKDGEIIYWQEVKQEIEKL